MSARDLEGRRNLIWWRRGIIALLVVLLLLGAADVFGQRPAHTTVVTPAASLELYAPTRLRGTNEMASAEAAATTPVIAP